MQDKFHITLVRSRIKSRPYTKVDGVYRGPTWNNNIGLQTINNSPSEFMKITTTLQTKVDTCMVTGTAVRPEILDTDRTLKNFIEQPISVLTLDLDKYESPNIKKYGKGVTYYQAIEDADDFINTYLPPEFKNVTYIIRFSSSFLMKEESYLRVHLIFLLEEPQYPREIGMWLKQEKIPADATFYFNLTQPIFTAAPIWDNYVDPLSLKDPYFPRVGIVQKKLSHVQGNWQPYYTPKYTDPITIANLPSASRLPGKVGSFCRMIDPQKVLISLGYIDMGEGRFLAPSSETGVPGAIIFSNGYVFSHHEGDPINQIVSEIFNFKRQSLNAYDMMNGWAIINKDLDPSIFKEFEFLLNQAIITDIDYQNEVQQELLNRLEWLVEGEYEGTNRKIIDNVIHDTHGLGLSEMSRNFIFNTIKAKTKHINIDALKSVWKNIKKDHALNKDAYDPEANLRHMANIFKRQQIIYSHHKNTTGDFWCYFGDTRIWKRCNPSQTKAFIYSHVHAAMPMKIEIDYFKIEKLMTIIMREACLSMSDFDKGRGWAFKGGKYGIIMEDLFLDSHQWQLDKAVKTLHKTDHIYKELPVTYKQWKENTGQPINYIDFLVSSCEEDMEATELLREFGGYVLADSYYLHKMLILEGVPGSGKSILAKILQACVGTQYHTAISIPRLAGRFGLGELPGKKLAVMSEARGADFTTLRALVPTLLRIVGQDFIDTEAKHKAAISEMLECKIFIMTNRTPVIPDDTGALSQRLMMVRFNKCFRGTEDEILGLDQRIFQDGLASIIRWHLKGLERLSRRKVFVEPLSGIAAKKVLMEQIDPLKTFIETYFELDQSVDHKYWIVQKEFIRYFRAYLKRLGQPTDDAGSKIQKRASIRNVQTLFPKVIKKRALLNDKYVWKLSGVIPRTELGLEFAEELSSLE